MKKRIFGTIFTMSMLITFVGCNGGESKKNVEGNETSSNEIMEKGEEKKDVSNKEKVGETVLKLSFNQSIDNPEAVTILEMSDNLYDETSGRYSIEVYPNEQLGNQKDSLESVQNGAIEMAIVANTIVENVNPDFAIIGTPYIYDSIDQQQKLFESNALDELFASTKDNGFRTIAVYGLGARCLYGKNEYKTPEDLSGQKIRVMQSETMANMLNMMGGVATPMAQGDVYSAIQSGTLDGAENNIITYVDLLQYEVAPYFTETNHLMIPDELIINNNVFDSMSKEDQEALLKVSKESITTSFEKSSELRSKYYDKAKNELGVTITEIDIKPFQERLEPMIKEASEKSETTKKIYEEILKLK